MRVLLALLVILASVALGWGEVRPNPARVAFVSFSGPADNLMLFGFRVGMREKGYVEGQSLVLQERYAEGHFDRLPGLISESLSTQPDVLFTVSSQAAIEAKRTCPTVPVVAVTGDPIAAGIVTSLQRPGGNMTGVSLVSGEYSSKWLELLKEVVPNLHRVVLFWNPDNPTIARQKERLQAVALETGIELLSVSARVPEIEAALASAASYAPDGLIISDDGGFYVLARRLITFANERHLPTISGLISLVREGGLMCYSADFIQVGRRAASQVDRILRGGLPNSRLIRLPNLRSPSTLRLQNNLA